MGVDTAPIMNVVNVVQFCGSSIRMWNTNDETVSL